MTDIHTFTTPSGDEMVVLPKAAYDSLLARLAEAEAEEDAADAAAYEAAMADLASGKERVLSPGESLEVLAQSGAFLRAARKAKNLTQAQVAEAAGVGQGYLSDIESGRRRGSADVLERIAAALDLRPTPSGTSRLDP